MNNTTQCELCGDNKSDNSLYCLYCRAINDTKSHDTHVTNELSVPMHKKRTLTAIFIISGFILVMMILSSVFDSMYNIFGSIKSNMKKIVAVILGILLIAVFIYYGTQRQTKPVSEEESTESSDSSSGSNTQKKSEELNIEEKDLLQPEEEERDLGEVFHVSDKSYTYNEARAICKKYGADLATPSQVYKMYLKGTSWCNPGWSEGQHVIFPSTQESVNEANSNAETKGSCGKVGLNGMFESNISSKFGANCYSERDDIDSSGI